MSFLRGLGRLGSKIFGSKPVSLGRKILRGGTSIGRKVVKFAESPLGKTIRGFLPAPAQTAISTGLELGKRVLGGAEKLEKGLAAGEKLSRRAAAGRVSREEALRLAEKGVRAGAAAASKRRRRRR